jgi:hypothetical protein
MPSWRDDQLKKSTGTTLPFTFTLKEREINFRLTNFRLTNDYQRA